ncbi:hypothetical protein Xhom_03318 [Xenorhabdus hominickii]|uniref:Uncharacterized protein n=1 Tax=Xenorhabdus hominickii TaxID=351679 RepID=A0A2G0Q4W9_XENHO|nr:hypothetical protein Xhom_03318 [Xenorhabdus hominickii]
MKNNGGKNGANYAPLVLSHVKHLYPSSFRLQLLAMFTHPGHIVKLCSQEFVINDINDAIRNLLDIYLWAYNLLIIRVSQLETVTHTEHEDPWIKAGFIFFLLITHFEFHIRFDIHPPK